MVATLSSGVQVIDDSISFFTSPKTSSFSSLSLIIAACAIGFTSSATTPHSLAGWSSRHNALQPLQKRASGQFTFYAVGPGARGKRNTEDDFESHPAAFVYGVRRSDLIFGAGCRAKHSSVCATIVPGSPVADRFVREQSWDGGSRCFGMVTITVGSKTALAQIVDRCVSCGPEDLYFSPSLFHHFGGTEAQGVMHRTWYFSGEESKPVPTATTTPKPKPFLTSVSTRPSSTSTPPPSSSPDVAAPAPTGVLAQSLLSLGDLGGLVLAAWTAR